jgi:hypothetical protein
MCKSPETLRCDWIYVATAARAVADDIKSLKIILVTMELFRSCRASRTWLADGAKIAFKIGPFYVVFSSSYPFDIKTGSELSDLRRCVIDRLCVQFDTAIEFIPNLPTLILIYLENADFMAVLTNRRKVNKTTK